MEQGLEATLDVMRAEGHMDITLTPHDLLEYRPMLNADSDAQMVAVLFALIKKGAPIKPDTFIPLSEGDFTIFASRVEKTVSSVDSSIRYRFYSKTSV